MRISDWSSDVCSSDLVPYVLGYRIGMGRVVTQRRLTSEEEEIEATIQRAYQVGLSCVRPGATCSEVDSAIRAVLVESGLAEYVVHRNGRRSAERRVGKSVSVRVDLGGRRNIKK